jgi:hypothetical protein
LGSRRTTQRYKPEDRTFLFAMTPRDGGGFSDLSTVYGAEKPEKWPTHIVTLLHGPLRGNGWVNTLTIPGLLLGNGRHNNQIHSWKRCSLQGLRRTYIRRPKTERVAGRQDHGGQAPGEYK